MKFFTPTGIVAVGDEIKIILNNEQKICRVKFIDMSTLIVDLYIEDETGGYTIKKHINELDYITTAEQITKPARYNKRGSLECWDVILDQEMNFLEGNVLKYLWRYKEKNGIEDLKKAKVYLEKLISEAKKNENN